MDRSLVAKNIKKRSHEIEKRDYPVACNATRRPLSDRICIPVTDRPGPDRKGIIWHRSDKTWESEDVPGENGTGLRTRGEGDSESDLGVNAGEFVAESNDFGFSLRFVTEFCAVAR